MSLISLEYAVFISLLPYRKRLYRDGGWNQRQLTGDGPDFVIGKYFTGEEIRNARRLCADSMSRITQQETGFTSIWDDSYPRNLREIYDPPPVLFWTGDTPDFSAPCVSIVGTRKPAPVSLLAVRKLVQSLPVEYTIVSGFALGIDRAVHHSSIKEKRRTFAIPGSGVLNPGPLANMDLIPFARREGVPFSFISEFHPEASAKPYHFPRRNRIIAGLSHKIYVIQAPQKSGALITAQFALDEGREVAFFDHPLLSASDFNDGAREYLSQGADLIQIDLSGIHYIERGGGMVQPNLPGLTEKKMIWLGGKYYGEVPD